MHVHSAEVLCACGEGGAGCTFSLTYTVRCFPSPLALIVLIVMYMEMCILNDFSVYELSTHDKW